MYPFSVFGLGFSSSLTTPSIILSVMPSHSYHGLSLFGIVIRFITLYTYVCTCNILRSKDRADEEKEVEEDGQPPVAPVAGADPMDHEERC